jgi:hypothetical protein
LRFLYIKTLGRPYLPDHNPFPKRPLRLPTILDQQEVARLIDSASNARAKWLAARSAKLLPVPYFHIVFTLPHELSALVLQNKRLLYDLLYRASAAAMLELARDPKHLGAGIEFLGVLHTWGQNLEHHPHVNYIVPAGGLVHTRHMLRRGAWARTAEPSYLRCWQVFALAHRAIIGSGRRF